MLIALLKILGCLIIGLLILVVSLLGIGTVVLLMQGIYLEWRRKKKEWLLKRINSRQ